MNEKNTQPASEVIQTLNLQPLPEEGGYYRQTHKSTTRGSSRTFGIDSDGERSISTAIYFLIATNSFSALHRIKADEVFHFYAGDTVEMIQIDINGNLKRFIIGSDIANGETPQVVVPAGTWQALKVKSGGAWALMGTTVSPGFEFEDFELADRARLAQQFPHLIEDIVRFTRNENENAHP